MDKIALRATLRRDRSEHIHRLKAAGLLEEVEHAISTRIMTVLDDVGVVSAYLSDGEEVSPLPFLHAAHARGLVTALPHITTRDAPMRFLAWTPGDPLVHGPFGLRQPEADQPELTPDLILTPLLGFDRAMARLGQGAGYYDRVFARLPMARRIGLAWSVQEVAALPVDPWDMPLHAIVTEQEWIES